MGKALEAMHDKMLQYKYQVEKEQEILKHTQEKLYATEDYAIELKKALDRCKKSILALMDENGTEIPDMFGAYTHADRVLEMAEDDKKLAKFKGIKYEGK